jgi:hypothetical protein
MEAQIASTAVLWYELLTTKSIARHMVGAPSVSNDDERGRVGGNLHVIAGEASKWDVRDSMGRERIGTHE